MAVPRRLILLKKHRLTNVSGTGGFYFFRSMLVFHQLMIFKLPHNCSFISTRVMDTIDLLLLMKWHLYRQSCAQNVLLLSERCLFAAVNPPPHQLHALLSSVLLSKVKTKKKKRIIPQ